MCVRLCGIGFGLSFLDFVFLDSSHCKLIGVSFGDVAVSDLPFFRIPHRHAVFLGVVQLVLYVMDAHWLPVLMPVVYPDCCVSTGLSLFGMWVIGICF